jgi:hypothetical protein
LVACGVKLDAVGEPHILIGDIEKLMAIPENGAP